MDHNLIAIALIAAAVIGAVVFIRSRSKRANSSGKPGGSPFGIDNNER
jgi:hypothetical protein